jgi:DNA (cytosine-5)-methyltransferase 1
MKHLDLFSGIGGFSYAVDQVWDNVEHTFCEIDPYCQQVLKKHWKGAKIYGDIRELIADTERMRKLQPKGSKQDIRERACDCFILTGGFPCQPFSQAGKRKGTSDNRYLWKEMLRVIQLTKPQWVIAENVRGILTIEQGMVFEQVCLDLEGEGYKVQPFIIPAVAVNAPHRRDRVWFVAYSVNNNDRGRGEQDRETYEISGECGEALYSRLPCRADENNAPDTEHKRPQGGVQPGELIKQGGRENEGWEQNWLTVASRICILDDGLPVKLDGFELSKPRHRVERLKALGNSIVPQVAVEIMKGIRLSKEGGE